MRSFSKISAIENMAEKTFRPMLTYADEAHDTAEYEEWLDARSEEYELWLDTRSDTYEEWLDFRSESYEFWLDMKEEFWNGDMEKAKEKMQDFQEDINKLKEDQSQ